MKYLIVKDNNSEIPVIFPETMDHAEMACHFSARPITSAGKFRLVSMVSSQTPRKVIVEHGSTALGMPADSIQALKDLDLIEFLLTNDLQGE